MNINIHIYIYIVNIYIYVYIYSKTYIYIYLHCMYIYLKLYWVDCCIRKICLYSQFDVANAHRRQTYFAIKAVENFPSKQTNESGVFDTSQRFKITSNGQSPSIRIGKSS